MALEKVVTIDAKKAATIAAKYYQSIAPGESSKLTIEEIEYDDKGFWLITLGIGDVFGFGSSKPGNYKIFKIDASSGEVKSMKIRVLK